MRQPPEKVISLSRLRANFYTFVKCFYAKTWRKFKNPACRNCFYCAAFGVSERTLIANGGIASVIDAQEWDIVNGYKADVEQTRALGVKLSTFEEWCVRHKDDFDIE